MNKPVVFALAAALAVVACALATTSCGSDSGGVADASNQDGSAGSRGTGAGGEGAGGMGGSGGSGGAGGEATFACGTASCAVGESYCKIVTILVLASNDGGAQ